MNEKPWKRTFFTIWAGQAFSLVGSQVVHFSIAWWLTQTTGSAASLATVSVLGMLPQVVLGPFIGALVDRWERKKVMILADGIIAAITLGLTVLFYTGKMHVSYLYITALIRGTLGMFHWTSMQASTTMLVPQEELSRVAGMNQTLQGVLSFAAPPLGALVVGAMPMHGIMIIDVVTAIIAISPLLFVHIPQPASANAEEFTPRAVLRDVREGLRYVWGWPWMLIVLFMASIINFLLSPTGALTPLLVTRHFNGGAWHLSALESAMSLGMIGGGLLLSAWGGFKRRILTCALFLAGLGAGVLITGFSSPALFWLAVVGNVISGFSNPLVNGPLFAILQARIAPEMQGRVFTLTGSLSGAMAPLGMAIAAPVADNLGIQLWWRVGVGVCILMAVAMFFVPAVMKIEETNQGEKQPAGSDARLAESSTTN